MAYINYDFFTADIIIDPCEYMKAENYFDSHDYDIIIKITRLGDSFDTFYKRLKKYYYLIYIDDLSSEYDEEYHSYIQHNHFWTRPAHFMDYALTYDDKLRNLIRKQACRCTKWI